MEDQRFQSFVKDPRCRDIPKNVRKVKVDKRFQKMLKHKQFKGNNRIDERGRTINFSTSEKLKKLYHLKESSEEDDSSSENDQEDLQEKKPSSLKVKKNEKSKQGKSVDVSGDESEILQDKEPKHLQKDKTMAPKLISDLNENVASSDDDTHSSEEEDESVGSEEEPQNLENDSVTVQKNKVVKKQKIKTENLNSKKSSNLQDEKLSDASDEDISDSDDSEDSDSSTNDIFADPDEFDHNWEEWNDQAPDTDEISKRLAVCNMDWDRIRADDLLIVFNSFKPADGTINSVKIYPSEFGLKRMDAERLNGPPELVEETLDPEAEEKLDKKRAKFHREKLREYQLKRLQYHYAVVDCDSPETADHLYVELNGKEYESSSVRFDLRFIPDDTTFDHAPVSEAYKVPDPSEYRPRYFVSTALGQAKVDLTWDETDPQRKEVLDRAFKEPDNIEKDIKDYLASSSGESEEEQVDKPESEEKCDKKMKLNDRISKYKELLQSLEEKGKEEEEKYDMEISWQPDLKEKTEKLVKQKLEEPQNPFDEMIRKKKEERKLKKQKKTAINKDEEESNSDEESDEDYSDASSDEKPTKKENKKLDELYLISDSKKALDQSKEKSSKKKKKKNKQQKSEPEKTQDLKFVEDERFSAIYTSPEFNLDPSDPHFKKTEGNLAFIQEKQRRLKTKEHPTDGNRKTKKAKYW